MKKHLERLRNKPEEHKQKIVRTAAFIVTGIIVVIYIIILSLNNPKANNQSVNQETQSEQSSFLDSFGSTFDQVGSSFNDIANQFTDQQESITELLETVEDASQQELSPKESLEDTNNNSSDNPSPLIESENQN